MEELGNKSEMDREDSQVVTISQAKRTSQTQQRAEITIEANDRDGHAHRLDMNPETAQNLLVQLLAAIDNAAERMGRPELPPPIALGLHAYKVAIQDGNPMAFLRLYPTAHGSVVFALTAKQASEVSSLLAVSASKIDQSARKKLS
jgi:hypothetical protein